MILRELVFQSDVAVRFLRWLKKPRKIVYFLNLVFVIEIQLQFYNNNDSILLVCAVSLKDIGDYGPQQFPAPCKSY